MLSCKTKCKRLTGFHAQIHITYKTASVEDCYTVHTSWVGTVEESTTVADVSGVVQVDVL